MPKCRNCVFFFFFFWKRVLSTRTKTIIARNPLDRSEYGNKITACQNNGSWWKKKVTKYPHISLSVFFFGWFKENLQEEHKKTYFLKCSCPQSAYLVRMNPGNAEVKPNTEPVRKRTKGSQGIGTKFLTNKKMFHVIFFFLSLMSKLEARKSKTELLKGFFVQASVYIGISENSSYILESIGATHLQIFILNSHGFIC